jgi:hypothetical protein
MYNLKFELDATDIQLSEELKNALDEKNIKVIKSAGFLGNTDIVVALIGATPLVITQVAKIIKTYIERNKSKSFKIKIGEKEMSFSGLSMKEMEDVFKQFSQNV